MTGRSYSVLSGLFLICLLNVTGAALALDADPALISAPDKKPFVMTVMGVRKAFPVSDDTIRVEIGAASNSGVFNELGSFRIVSEDDPEYAYDSFVCPSDISFPKNDSVVEVTVPEKFKAESSSANITEFKRGTVDLKLHAPMQSGKTYAVVTRGHGTDVVSAGRAATQFRFDPADIVKAPDIQHKPDLMTLTVMGLRGLDSVGNGIIRLEFGPTFFCQEGYLLKHYHVSVNGEPVTVKAMGRRSQIDLYRPIGWPYSVIMQHEVFLQMDRVLAEGDRLRVEVDPAVVSGANTAEIVFSDKRSFSSAVKVNQVGYITSAVKIAEIGRWLGSFPDELAILEMDGDSERRFRNISTDEIFFGSSAPNTEKSENGKKESAEKMSAQDKQDAVSSGTVSVSEFDFSKTSLKYDVPPAFEIRDARTDEVVFSGQSVLSHPGNRSEGGRAPYSGENVYEIDFTSFKTPGRYYIAVPGTGRSFEFSIASDVYDEAFQTAAYGVFAQRCGIALEPPYSDWRRIACHDRGIQLTTQRRIDGGSISAKKAIFEKNPSPDVAERPAIYAGPGLIAHFPFDGFPVNSVPGGMLLSPAKGVEQSFKVLPNLIWDGESNRVFETKSGRDNGWTGTLPDYDKTKGLTFHFWLRRTDAIKGNHFDGTLMSLRSGKSSSFSINCIWGIPYYWFDGSRFYSGSRFGDDRWHCHTIVIEPESDGRWTCKVYRDGKYIRTGTASDRFAPGNELTIGAITNEGAEGCYFDEFRVYNRALSAEEIEKLSERVEAVVPKRIQASGGHHDAGDYNPRSHIDVAQVLMDAYEVAPKKFYDGQLNIPEKDNGIPDILDEALWALKLWIGLQDEDGGVYNGTESDGDPNFFQTVELDPKGDFAFAKDSQGSLLFAGAMAQASRLLKKVGKQDMAADYLARARRAYDWGVNNKPETNSSKTFASFYTAPLAYAAAQLFHTTGEKAYHQAFLENIPWRKNPKAKMITDDNSYNLTLAAYAYAAVPPSMADATVHSDVVRAICDEADMYINASNRAAYKFIRHPYAPINWGTGAYEHFLTVVWHAWAFTDNKLKVKSYREAMIKTADNTLGCNPLNLSWIVGLGSNSIHAPLHNSRFNPDGFSVRGLQAQGPDSEGKEYNYASTLFPARGKTPRLYCFIDSIFAIGMDEGTVNTQAETMAAFGLLLPDVKTPAEKEKKGNGK